MYQHFYFYCDFKLLPNSELLSFIFCGGHSETFLIRNDSWFAAHGLHFRYSI